MKNRTVIRHSASMFALILGATTVPTQTAQAQTAPAAIAAAEADDANAITVTARRVDERLQDVPLAVSVLTAQDFKRQGIDDLSDVADRTVGFSFEAITPLVIQPAIRGQTNLRTTSPVQNVPVYIDGIYLQRGYLIDQSLIEIDRLEWLDRLVARLRAMFDLDADPQAIDALDAQFYNAATHRAAFALPTYVTRALAQ